jgi:hypothetical protein
MGATRSPRSSRAGIVGHALAVLNSLDDRVVPKANEWIESLRLAQQPEPVPTVDPDFRPRPDVVTEVENWKRACPAFAEIWDRAHPGMQQDYLRWMGKPRSTGRRIKRVRGAVRDSLQMGELSYVQYTLTQAMAAGPFLIPPG